jgi:hypothetical protein
LFDPPAAWVKRPKARSITVSMVLQVFLDMVACLISSSFYLSKLLWRPLTSPLRPSGNNPCYLASGK